MGNKSINCHSKVDVFFQGSPEVNPELSVHSSVYNYKYFMTSKKSTCIYDSLSKHVSGLNIVMVIIWNSVAINILC